MISFSDVEYESAFSYRSENKKKKYDPITMINVPVVAFCLLTNREL